MKKVLEMFGEPIISGGQEAFVNNLVMNIDCDALTIDLFTPYYCDNDIYKQNVIDKGGQVYEAKLKFEPGKSRKNIVKPLKELLAKTDYDVIHIHSGSISVLAYSAQTARVAGVKRVIVHSHSPAEHESLKHILIKLYTKRIMEKYPTDYFACSLNAAMCKFSKKIVKNKVKFINNGINLEKYAYSIEIRELIRKQLQIPENAFVIGHVGRFSHEKNHMFLIDVFYALRNKNHEAYLVLAGDGETLPKIKDKVKKLQIEKYVYFLGNISNVNEIMQAIDVFVLPSLYEGLPLVGVEAQAAGLPLIVSDHVSEEIRMTNQVRFLSIQNTDEWVNAISELKSKPRYSSIDVLREKGFDIKYTTKLISNIYLDISN